MTRPLGRLAALSIFPLFVLHNALWILHGLRTGRLLLEDATAGSLAAVDGVVFGLAFALTALALLAVGNLLAAPHRRLARIGAALAVLSLCGTLAGTATLVATGAPVPLAFPVATLSQFLSAIVLGMAHLRSGTRPRSAGVALVLFGLTTMPLAFALPALLGGVLPEYALFEAHFLIAGALWAVVGMGRAPTSPTVPPDRAAAPSRTWPSGVRTTALALIAFGSAAAAEAQRPADAVPPLSAEASAYLGTALDSLEAVSLRRSITDWAVVRDSAFLLAAGAQRPDQTYGALNWALGRVDPHSFLQARFPWVNPEMVAGSVAYLRVPYHPAGSQVSLADTLQSAIRDLDERGACGWIVDLRMNGGGNVWPMLAGIGPLLGDSLVAVALADGRPASRTVYADGAAVAVEADGTRTAYAEAEAPHTLRRPGAPVAVLIDGATGSSGEAVAIAFRTRPATRFFGQPTYGYTTANRGVQLADGANMVVTVDPMTDRDGREYVGPIEPDERVPLPDTVWPTSVDAVARRATAWLLQQPACSAAAPSAAGG